MRKLIFCIATLIFVFQSCSKDDNLAEETPQPIEGKGYTMLNIGNSFFRPYAEKLDEMALEAGFTDHNSTIVFKGGQNGRAINLWNDSTSEEHKLIKSTLDSGNIDFLGMTSGHDTINPIEGFQAWIEYALTNNPNITVFISLATFDYPNGDAKGTRPDWDTFALENGYNSIQEFYDYYVSEVIHNEIVDKLRTEFPSTKIFTIPTGWATFNLNQMNIDGLLLDEIDMFGAWDSSIFTDQKGHQGDIVKKAGGLVWLNAIYNVDLDSNTYNTNYTTDLHEIAKEIIADHAPNYTSIGE